MKKRFLLVSVLLMSCSPTQIVENNEIQYEFNDENKTARVIESPKYNVKDLIIPETIISNNKEYNVVSIAKNSFLDNKYIENLVVPNSVSSIGYDAFRNCTNLKSVSFSNSVKTIPDHLFAGCTSLSSFEGGNGVEVINKGAFRNSKLTSISFNNISELNIDTFFNFEELKEVKILGSYTSLPGSFFENCTSLVDVELSSSLVKVDSYAFKNCTSLDSFNFENITNLGVSSFENTGFKNLSLTLSSMGIWCFYNCKNLENLSIDVLEISEKCFYNCQNLKNLNLKNVNKISTQAFYKCGIESLIIPSSLVEISSQAFENSSLKSLSFEDNSSLKIISRNAFYNCSLSGELVFPLSVKSIYNNAFTNNDLEVVKISSSTSIDNNVFDENVKIERY